MILANPNPPPPASIFEAACPIERRQYFHWKAARECYEGETAYIRRVRMIYVRQSGFFFVPLALFVAVELKFGATVYGECMILLLAIGAGSVLRQCWKRQRRCFPCPPPYVIDRRTRR